MSLRLTVAIVVALTTALFAQDGPSRGGRGGRFGPEGGGQPGLRLVGAVAGAPGRVVRNAPYSAEAVTETSQTLADGNRIRQVSTAKVYRDSEGRVRNEQSLTRLGALAPGSAFAEVVFISDPVAGATYALNTRDKTATRTSFGRPGQGAGDGPMVGRGGPGGPGGQQPQGGRWGNPDAAGRGERRPRDASPDRAQVRLEGPQNVKRESLGKQNIEGVMTEGTKTTMVIPAGQVGNEAPIQVVSESWYSPELQTVILSKHSDPRSGESTFRLTNLSRAEPAPALFQPPSDYKVLETRGGGRGPGAPQLR